MINYSLLTDLFRLNRDYTALTSALTAPAALVLGTVFALASSLVPALLILALAGTLSTKITAQLGRALPWFQLAVYTLYLVTAVRGLIK